MWMNTSAGTRKDGRRPDIITAHVPHLKDVEGIARLARLRLTGEQMEHYRGQLSSILDHVARLQELDTRNIPPTTGGGLASMPLRDDEPHLGLGMESLMKNAPDVDDNQFKVPRVFE